MRTRVIVDGAALEAQVGASMDGGECFADFVVVFAADADQLDLRGRKVQRAFDQAPTLEFQSSLKIQVCSPGTPCRLQSKTDAR